MSKKSASPSASVEPMVGGECAAELPADLAKVLPQPQSGKALSRPAKALSQPKSPQVQRGVARTKRPERRQVEMRCLALDQMVEPAHRVRLVWQYAEACDLSELYEQIQAVEGGVGRNAVDPRLLFALWLYATIEGVTSARQLAVLTTRDLPYQWLCGGVSVNYDLLSRFRAQQGKLLKRLLIHSVGVLLQQQLITLDTVAQDGMRVRAHAGSGSFHKAETLEAALVEAQTHVEELEEQHAADPTGVDRRRQAAQERAATERVRKIELAQAELQKLNERAKKPTKPTPPPEPSAVAPGAVAASEAAVIPQKSPRPPRASTTDPEARRMKMGDGGFRPAYNVQFATDAQTRLVVATDVTNQGTDVGLMQPMHAQIIADYGVTPDKYLVDGGFAKMADVTVLEQAGTALYAPLPCEKKHIAAGKDPYTKKPGDTVEMAAFRQRMGTAAAKELYKQRGSIAEFPNADCRNRGLTQFRVRGTDKTTTQTLWHVLTFNLLRFINLGFLKTIVSH